MEKLFNLKLTQNEIGGITQEIRFHQANNVLFFDTPGHKAFNSFRELIIEISDVVFLIIDINVGVQLQTKEAIYYWLKYQIKNKKLFIILNKIDKLPKNLHMSHKNKIINSLENLNLTIYNNSQIEIILHSNKNTENIESIKTLIEVVKEDIKPIINFNSKNNEGKIISISFVNKEYQIGILFYTISNLPFTSFINKKNNINFTFNKITIINNIFKIVHINKILLNSLSIGDYIITSND